VSDARQRELERRYLATGSAQAERDYLCELARSGTIFDADRCGRLAALDSEAALAYFSARGVEQPQLEMAARFGSSIAAACLGVSPCDSPCVLSHEETELGAIFGGWEPALRYYSSVLDAVMAWWELQGDDERSAIMDLHSTRQAVRDWLDGGRSVAASRLALAWARAGGARAELLEGRFGLNGRPFWNLAHGLATMAYACVPLEALREYLDAYGGDEGELRLRCVIWASHHVVRAVGGVAYAEHPVLNTNSAGFEDLATATRRRFEQPAAEIYARALLRL
jgi:hypothetical protein